MHYRHRRAGMAAMHGLAQGLDLLAEILAKDFAETHGRIDQTQEPKGGTHGPTR